MDLRVRWGKEHLTVLNRFLTWTAVSSLSSRKLTFSLSLSSTRLSRLSRERSTSTTPASRFASASTNLPLTDHHLIIRCKKLHFLCLSIISSAYQPIFFHISKVFIGLLYKNHQTPSATSSFLLWSIPSPFTYLSPHQAHWQGPHRPWDRNI